MSLVPSLLPWLQPFFQNMTAPTAASLQTVLAGWILARRHTVSSALLIQEDLPKHFSSYHRLFAAAHWSLDAVGLALLKLLRQTFLACDEFIHLVVDDTLCRRRGYHVYGAGMHYDPLLTGRKLSNANRSLKSRGHCWVVLGVVLQFPFRPGHSYCLPLLFRLCLNQKTAEKHHCVYRSRPQLAMQMLARVCNAFPQAPFHLLVDSAYAGQQTLRDLPDNCQMTARWIANAHLHEPAPPPTGRKGRAPKRGKGLGKTAELLERRRQRLEIELYGQHQQLRVADAVACLRTVPERRLRVVASEPLSQGGRPRSQQRAVYYSTVWAASAQQVLSWYAMRWSIELTFHDAKQQLGLNQPQGWSPQAVRRLAPTLLLLYSVVVLWFAAEGHRQYRPRRGVWYPAQPQASFAEMLATLRQACLETTFSEDLPVDRQQRKWWQTLLAVVKQAA